MGTRGVTGELDASDLRVALVVSRYNQDISDGLLEGAVNALVRHGADMDQVNVYWVPGAMELPVVAQALAESGHCDAVVCLGCVIKGETAHFDYVAGQAAAGLGQVALATGIPCAFGVLTTYDRGQALARSRGEENKGAEAAETAIEVANLLRLIGD
jgi:6,7-dimethyl-8-ribityllumazine synthase